MMGQEYTLSKFADNSELELLVVPFRDLDRLWRGIDLDLRIL